MLSAYDIVLMAIKYNFMIMDFRFHSA